MFRIAIVAYEDCISSAVSGALDVFSVANWAHRSETGAGPDADPLFEAVVVSADGRPVRGFNRLPIAPHAAIDAGSEFDLILVPPWLGDMETILQTERPTIAWLRERHRRGTCVSGVCTGTFLVAEAGLLAGREATTHWFWVPQFRTRYPTVALKPEQIVIDEGDVICAGGMTAYLDLCLYLVSRFGTPDLASACSKLLLVDSGRRSQAPYRLHSFRKNHADEDVLRVQQWLETHAAEAVTVQRMAEVAGLEKRTFMRRFKRATGDSPGAYVQHLRVEAARRMLETTGQTVSEITWQVGYRDVSSFLRLFKQHTGLTPGAYRDKFSLLYKGVPGPPPDAPEGRRPASGR